MKDSKFIEQICHSVTLLILCVIRLPVGIQASSMMNVDELIRWSHNCSTSISGFITIESDARVLEKSPDPSRPVGEHPMEPFESKPIQLISALQVSHHDQWRLT
jgi:hypothetical protein